MLILVLWGPATPLLLVGMQVDAPDGASPYVLAGHQGEVTAVAWCPSDFHQARPDRGRGQPGRVRMRAVQALATLHRW